jgi:hypothetical protein
MEKFNVYLKEGAGEVTVRLGEAEEIKYPKGITIAGILAAPHQFLSGKPDTDPKQCHLQIKKDTGEIKLIILDTDNRGSSSTITGSLKSDGHFAAWQINSEKRWTVAQFLKHIKMYKSFFTTAKDCDDMVASFQKWNAKIETVIKEHNDNSGNSLAMLEKKVSDIDLVKRFSLTIPIFQGYAKQTFAVEIGLEPKQNAVELYLFSNDLFTLEIEHREKLIDAELAKFSEFACSKVVLS